MAQFGNQQLFAMGLNPFNSNPFVNPLTTGLPPGSIPSPNSAPKNVIKIGQPSMSALAKALAQSAFSNEPRTPFEALGKLAQLASGTYADRRAQEQDLEEQRQRYGQIAKVLDEGGNLLDAGIASQDPEIMKLGVEQKLKGADKVSPYSDLAKINADEQNGLLTPEQANDARTRLAQSGGGYEGNNLDAQNWNIINSPNSDPSSARYASAYYQLFQQPKINAVQMQDGTVQYVPTYTDPPPNVRPPSYAAPDNSATTGPALASSATTDLTPRTRAGAPLAIEGAGPKATDTQLITAGYADRLAESDAQITALEQSGLSYQDTVKSGAPFGLGNYLVSDAFRQLDQAKRNFVNASLRRESGAVISPSEFENANIQYFPQPGDDPGTLEFKRRNRAAQINNFARASGPSYKAPTLAAPFASNTPFGEAWNTSRANMPSLPPPREVRAEDYFK